MSSIFSLKFNMSEQKKKQQIIYDLLNAETNQKRFPK